MLIVMAGYHQQDVEHFYCVVVSLMRAFVPVFFTLLLIVSCNSVSRPTGSLIGDCSYAEEIEIPPLKDTILKYSDFCSRVECIPLESTIHSMIGSITKLEVVSDGGFIVFDISNVLLLRFGSDGRFLNRIGRPGNKDDEYIQITDFAYNPYNNEVVLWDITKSMFLYYDLGGNYLRQSPIEWHNGKISVLDDSHLALYVGEVDEKKGNTYKYKYVITSYDGNGIISEIPDNDLSPNFLGMKIHFLNRNNDHIYCKSEYSYQIYELTLDGLGLAYSVSYSDKTIPRKWFKMDSSSLFKRLSEDSERAYCSEFYETEHYYLVISVKNKRLMHLSVQERSGAKNIVSGYIVLNDMYEDNVLSDFHWSSFGDVSVRAVNGDDIYFCIGPRSITEDEYRQIRQKICRELTDTVEQSLVLSKWDEEYRLCQNDNPVLLKCTLK